MDKVANSQRIKIAFVISSNLKDWAGVEHVLYEYIKKKPIDFEVVIIQFKTASVERVSDEFINEEFSHINIISVPNHLNKLNFFNSYKVTYALNEILIMPAISFFVKFLVNRKLHKVSCYPDIYYFFNAPDAGRLLNKPKHTIYVGSEHSWNFLADNFLKKIQTKLILKGLIFREIDHYHLFPSESQLLDQGLSGFTLPNGVQTNQYKPNKLEVSNLKILFFARLEECKGTRIVLDVWNILKNFSNITLTVIGSGSMGKVVSKIEDRNFYYKGFVSEKELPSVISECNVFLYPSLCDSYPLVVLQALSSGLFVLTNDKIASNFQEFVELGQIKVVKNDVVSYTRACENIKNYGFNFDTMTSRRLCVEKYDWKYVSKKLYKELSLLHCG